MQNKNLQKPRRKYDASLKQEVVGMIAAGRSVPEIARSLGIGENIIYRWRKQALNSTEQTDAPTAWLSVKVFFFIVQRFKNKEITLF